MTKALLCLLVVTALASLSGCAGSSTDRDFRSKVKSVNVGGQVTQQGDQTSGSFTTTFELRDPSDK